MAEVLTIHEKLLDIQQRLKVPKDINNDFGGFKYRNIEEIENKVKPYLAEHRLTLTFDDGIIEAGGRVYVQATAILSDGKDSIRVNAFAREAQNPKAKMDDSQLTGSCSSYARKYAAGGMFLIDDTKDADGMDNSKPAPKKTEAKPVGKAVVEYAKPWEVKNLQIAAKKIIGQKPEDEVNEWLKEKLKCPMDQFPREWYPKAQEKLDVMLIEKG